MNAHFDAWARDAERRGLAPRYIAQQQTRVRHLTQFAAGKPVDSDLIRAWLEHLAESGIVRPTGQRQPCSPKTLNNHLAAIRAFFGWCVDAGLIQADPSAGVAWAKARRRKGRVISARQAWALFEAAQQDEQSRKPRSVDQAGRVIRRAAFYRTLIATGIRAGAAEGLRVRDFELTAEPPRIIVRAENDKSGQERSLMISEADRQFFLEELDGLPPAAPALTRPHYRVLYADAVACGIPVKDAQGRGLGFHCFRRWHGTEMDRQGFSLNQIKERLGHRSVITTMDYLVRELEEQQGVAERLAQVGQKSSGFPVASGGGMNDNSPATNGPPKHPSEIRGERPAPAVCRYSIGAGPPRFLTSQSGPPPGRHEEGSQQAPSSKPESGRQDLNLRPGRDAEAQVAADLLHRYFDLLSRGPGPMPEVPREPESDPPTEW